ncbi:MAG: hypothetical protein MI861_19110 [Pirellulales bacterium]|nr:hypothetical protein [Pirellulales bacterium]
MKRIAKYAPALVATLLVATCTNSATADWHEFWHNLHVGYYRNNAWPEPFNEVDALDVVAPFEIMKHNGWKMHNTIGHELFRDGDGALLASGSKRVQWIATQAPASRRTVYVLRGDSRRETQARVASVNQALASIQVVGPKPNVMITDVVPASAPGDWAVKINRERIEQIPPPRLPSTSSNGTQGATQ